MTESKQNAAQLVAAGRLTIRKIAREAGVSERTVAAWKTEPEFQAEVQRISDEWREEARGKGVADRDIRLRDLNDRYRRLRAVIQARAKDPQMQLAPGGKTGLLTVTYKMQSKGEGLGSAAVPEYSVDTGLLQEMREIEEHAAAELGQKNPEPVADQAETSVAISIIERLHAGRERVAQAKRDADAKKA